MLGSSAAPDTAAAKAAAVGHGQALASTVVMDRVSRVFSLAGSFYVAQRPLAEGEPFHVLQIAPDGTSISLPTEGMPVSTKTTAPEALGAEMRAPTALYGSKDGALWLATTNSASSFGGPSRVYRLKQDKLGAGADSWECVSGCHDQDSEAAWAARFGTSPFKGSPRFLRLGLEGSGRLLAFCNKEQRTCDYFLLPSPLPKNASTAIEKAKPLGAWTTSTELADGSVLLGMSGISGLGVSRMLLVTDQGTRSYALPRAGLTSVQAHSADRILIRMGEEAWLLEGGTLTARTLPLEAVAEGSCLAPDGTLWSIDRSGTLWSLQADVWKAAGHVPTARPGTRLLEVTPGAVWLLVPDDSDAGAPTDKLLKVAVP